MKLPELNSSVLIRAQVEEARFVAQMGLLGPNFLPYEASIIAIHRSHDLIEY